MILLTVDEIIGLHAKLIAKTGGSDVLIELGLSIASGKARYEDILSWIQNHR